MLRGERYSEAAVDEIELLKQVAASERAEERNLVLLRDSFVHRGVNGKHHVLAFEVLGDNLLALIKENHAIYDEIIALRADETRRCTVYMVFGAVLFGILFMYIDRLQGHVKTLNKLLIHPHTSRATEYLQSPRHIQVGSVQPWFA